MAQIRNLFDHSALSAVAPQSSRVLALVTAVLLYVAVTYPFQPVVFLLLGASPQVVYALLCLAGVVASSAYRRPTFAMEHKLGAQLVVAVLTCSMLLTLVRYQNPTVIRELLVLAFIVMLVFRAHGAATLRIIRLLVYISVVALVPALVIVALFHAGLIDWPTWAVGRLGLAPGSPVINRQISGDANYYLPLWLALVPDMAATDQGFGLHFTRQPLIYMEPTDTWYFTGGLFWFAVADRNLAARGFCLTIMAIALAVSFSVAGVIATILGAVICLALTFGGRKAVYLIIAAGALLLVTVPLDHLVAIVGGNKAGEFEHYKANVEVLSHVTLFGNPATGDDQPLSYGALTVLYRYGVLGAAVLLAVVSAMAVVTFAVLQDQARLGWRRFPLFLGCFVSLAGATKFPSIVPAMPAILLAGTLSLRQGRTDPFTLGLLTR